MAKIWRGSCDVALSGPNTLSVKNMEKLFKDSVTFWSEKQQKYEINWNKVWTRALELPYTVANFRHLSSSFNLSDLW